MFLKYINNLRSEKGSTYLAMLVLFGAGLYAGMNALQSSQYSRQTMSLAREKLVVDNFANAVASGITFDRPCSDFFGQMTYTDGSTDAFGSKLEVNGTDFFNGKIPGSSLVVQAVSLAAIPAVPTDDWLKLAPEELREGGVKVGYDRYKTRIRIMTSSEGNDDDGKIVLKYREFPVVAYVNSATKIVTYCASNAEALTCDTMQGVYTPPTTERPTPHCDLRPPIGGCAEGGHFMVVADSQCQVPNPFLVASAANNDGCDCPSGFAAAKSMDYRASKELAMTQYTCLNCSARVTPTEAIAASTSAVYYSDEQFARDMACMRKSGTTYTDPTCPCSSDPTSLACICTVSPNSDPQCNDPCALNPDGCDCVAKKGDMLEYDCRCSGMQSGPQCAQWVPIDWNPYCGYDPWSCYGW